MASRGRGIQVKPDHLRSQSMVPELESSIDKMSIDEATGASNRSRSIVKSSIEKAVSISSNNYKFNTRPDQGGKSGRTTQLTTNFYKIEIDYTKFAYHYDIEIVYQYTRKDGSSAQANAKKELKK